MADATVLRVESISLAFGGLKVLEDVSFAARACELLARLGPNGAGKTSVLNCICGIYRPGAGRVEFAGAEITRARPHRVAALGIARTFQHGELFPHMTVLENMLVARHARMTTGVFGESLFLRNVRDAEVEHRRADEEGVELDGLGRYRHPSARSR